MAVVLGKILTTSLVEKYQKKVLHGVTEINTKMQTLPVEDRMAYLLHAESFLSLQIDEVRVYVQQLNAPKRAQDLTAMLVVEQDLVRTLNLVRDLQERHRLGSATNQPKPSAMILRGDGGAHASITATEAGKAQIASLTGENIGDKSEKPAIKGILRQSRQELVKDLSPIIQGSGKVQAMKEELGFK